MTSRIAFAVLLLCPFATGCGGLYKIGTRNLFNEAKLIRDEKFEKVRYACLAHEAWECIKSGCPPGTYSTDYGQGFQDGYVDYLFSGGNGEPLTMPPRRYRHFHAESPAGVKALQDWYAGFRHGALAAKESGQRRFVLVALPLPRPAPPPPPVGGPPPEGPPLAEQLMLPAPRSLAPATPLPLSLPRPASPEAPAEPKGSANGVDPKGTPDAPPEPEAEPPSEPAEEGPAMDPAPEEQP